ncbi:heavy metal translocating P-type ATPase [Devosia sp.]|uniref:heavy metal translocating P-type ATPase n=1 Tax=Devosia sp. TaxID=1871048 RepID=UPI003262F634
MDWEEVTAMTEAALKTRPVSIDIQGMTCASCVSRVEKALLKVPSVTTAAVNLATERATVQLADTGNIDALLKAIEKAGYSGTRIEEHAPRDHSHHHHDEDANVLKRDVMIAAALTLPLFVLEMGSHFFMPFHMWLLGLVPQQALYVAYFMVTSVVLFVPGWRFFKIGIAALLRGGPEMNSLVALGAGAAYLYSVVVTFAPALLPAEARYVYYEAAAVIVTLILVGRLLEALAKGRSNEAIRHLAGEQAKSARVERNGQTVDVPIAEVQVGDIILVRPGEKIATDGEVIDGASYVNEAMISGEAAPVEKAVGAAVIGGTLNTNGSLKVRATKIGADTMLAQIIRLVEDAQAGKLPIQLLVDKVTGWFVPAVMAVAVATFLVWLVWGPSPSATYGLINAVAVLIIACPCAMGLATPISIMVGTGRAAELGVLFRKSEALQQLQGVSVVAFDKTGTLTEGKPELTDLILDDDFEHDEVLALAAAVETNSEHPIAGAIVAAATARGLALGTVGDFKALPGHGVSAIADGRSVVIGAARQFAAEDLADFAKDIERLADAGKTPVFVSVDGHVAAAIVVADKIKAGSKAAIVALHARGLKTAMISGDNARTANAIARELGIDEVLAEVLPAGKFEAIKSLRQGGRLVAFVGDGINDAPALAEADVGIAVGTGTDAAIESADVVLLGGELKGVLNALDVSKATMGNIGQNLFWAFGYNALLIPLAAGALYPAFGILLSPMIGAGAMALSSVFVIANAQRLRAIAPAKIGDAR